MTDTCRICQRLAVDDLPVCASCLDAGAWIRISHGAVEIGRHCWHAVVEIARSGGAVDRWTDGPHDSVTARAKASARVDDEIGRYSGDWLFEISDLATPNAAPTFRSPA